MNNSASSKPKRSANHSRRGGGRAALAAQRAGRRRRRGSRAGKHPPAAPAPHQQRPPPSARTGPRVWPQGRARAGGGAREAAAARRRSPRQPAGRSQRVYPWMMAHAWGCPMLGSRRGADAAAARCCGCVRALAAPTWRQTGVCQCCSISLDLRIEQMQERRVCYMQGFGARQSEDMH